LQFLGFTLFFLFALLCFHFLFHGREKHCG
jgi:hypothetical protein